MTSISPSPCVACPRSRDGLCGATLNGAEGQSADGANWQSHRLLRAGSSIIRAGQVTENVIVLCRGWAFRFLNLPSGGRQILTFLLPGDVLSVASIFEKRVHYSVKALTDVQISEMQRVQMQSRLFGHPSIGKVLANLCSERERECDSTLAVVGHGSAEERIAHLLLQMVVRVAAHNVIRDNSYPIPLRQQHIADAVGLTAVHVSRVLGSLRARGVLTLSGGRLDVFDMPELARMAGKLIRYPSVSN